MNIYLLALLACQSPPEPLPASVLAASADLEMDRSRTPALYQLLYDYAFLPEVQHSEQRVRILIWLRHMQLTTYQLRELQGLHQRVLEERQRIEAAQGEIVRSYEERIQVIYDGLWEQLRQGAELEDEELDGSAQALLLERLQSAREDELLQLRTQSIRSILEAEKSWLYSLSPMQEALLTDATFFLRHRLDPYANPGDFRALVGTVFVAGDYGTLTRGSFDPDRDHLNLSALWTSTALSELQGPIFNEARRGLILYMILLEPSLIEAIEAALLSSDRLQEAEPEEAEGQGAEEPELDPAPDAPKPEAAPAEEE